MNDSALTIINSIFNNIYINLINNYYILYEKLLLIYLHFIRFYNYKYQINIYIIIYLF